MKNILIVVAVVIVLVVGYLVINWNSSGTGEMPAPSSTPEAQTPKPSIAPSVSAPQTQVIAIQNFFFTRPTIVIKKGDTVTWTNQDSAPHTVTGDNGGPASPTINKSGTYSFTFNTAGTFNYHCEFHPSMLGTIVVQ